MSHRTLASVSPLRGLLEVTRLLRAEKELPELLDAVARAISESLGYGTVAISLYRPAWDDFAVTTVHGSEAARTTLLGRVRPLADWQVLLDDRFLRNGAYVVPVGSVDWAALGTSYVPDGPVTDAPDAWHPEDGLFVRLRHVDGHLLGIVSVDEPANGKRPTDSELDVLVALGDHAALAVQAAYETAESARHRRALEALLSVSSGLSGTDSADTILARVCAGIHTALGFENVCVALVDPVTGTLVPHAAVGWRLDDPAIAGPLSVTDFEPLLDPEYEVEGCYLLPNDEARRRVPPDRAKYHSRLNGRGPWAWNRHWLLVPLREGDGPPRGVIWADDPEDRLLPSADRLQALRIFANEAAAAIASAAHLDELRFLADHDPLTRLLNRRAFVDRLDREVARAARYGRSFGLVVCDLDGFKTLNDHYGHQAGDEALRLFGSILSGALRRPDDAFRIGGDEFALLLAEASESDTREVVSRVTERLLLGEDGRLVGVRASFGCASCPDDAHDAQTLFRLADEALYAAKRNGSGLVFVA